MMALYDMENTLLSIGFQNMSLELNEVIMKENKLLDGTLHIQTIGEVIKSRKFKLICNEEQADLVNLSHSMGSNLKLVIDDKYYIGMINKPVWERITAREKDKINRWYSGEMTFTVIEEGIE